MRISLLTLLFAFSIYFILPLQVAVSESNNFFDYMDGNYGSTQVYPQGYWNNYNYNYYQPYNYNYNYYYVPYYYYPDPNTYYMENVWTDFWK